MAFFLNQRNKTKRHAFIQNYDCFFYHAYKEVQAALVICGLCKRGFDYSRTQKQGKTTDSECGFWYSRTRILQVRYPRDSGGNLYLANFGKNSEPNIIGFACGICIELTRT